VALVLVGGLPGVKSKVCTKCNEDKPTEDYYVNERKNGNTYYKSQCKTCVLLARKEYYPKVRSNRISYKRTYYRDNMSTLKEKQKVWRDNNLESRLARNANRRANKLNATPKWLTETHLSEIKNFYWLAKDLTAVSGETYHVDHIVPLKGENVCGLHVPWNLQVLPADINLSKGNRYANDA